MYSSLDELIAGERRAALNKMRPEPSAAERALDSLPLEDVKGILKQAERLEQRESRLAEVQLNADAWVQEIAPWWKDTARNAHLMKMQLKANGIDEADATIADYQRCALELRDAGLVTLNQHAVAKEHADDITRRAQEARRVSLESLMRQQNPRCTTFRWRN